MELSGLLGLFVSAFISATLFPGGSEAILLYQLQQGIHSPYSLVMVATLGNTLGGMSSWGLGRLLAWRFPAREWSERHQKAMSWLHRWGSPTLLLSWLPIIGDPLCLLAGWLRISPVIALIFIFLGKGLRYLLVAQLAGLF